MVRFHKYQGTGNDFIILDGMKEGVFLSPQEVEAVCERHTGIGADGVIFALTSAGSDAAMRIFNADGSEAEMCGNGIRCLAKYLYERSGVVRTNMFIETLAGTKSLRLSVSGGIVKEVEVDMGLPGFTALDLPAPDDPSSPGRVTIDIDGDAVIQAICLSVGNPHCVVFVEDVSETQVSRVGPVLEKHTMFPNRTNVEFVQVLDAHHIALRVWERGVGETKACGTGACAAAVAALHEGRCTNPVDVSLPGGVLKISADEYGHVLMTGPALEVFSGELAKGWRI